jgi:hypothetical protein
MFEDPDQIAVALALAPLLVGGLLVVAGSRLGTAGRSLTPAVLLLTLAGLAWLLGAGSGARAAGPSLVPSTPHALESRVEALFARHDQNADGLLSPAELGRPSLGTRLDRDRDGALSGDEARAAFAEDGAWLPSFGDRLGSPPAQRGAPIWLLALVASGALLGVAVAGRGAPPSVCGAVSLANGAALAAGLWGGAGLALVGFGVAAFAAAAVQQGGPRSGEASVGIGFSLVLALGAAALVLGGVSAGGPAPSLLGAAALPLGSALVLGALLLRPGAPSLRLPAQGIVLATALPLAALAGISAPPPVDASAVVLAAGVLALVGGVGAVAGGSGRTLAWLGVVHLGGVLAASAAAPSAWVGAYVGVVALSGVAVWVGWDAVLRGRGPSRRVGAAAAALGLLLPAGVPGLGGHRIVSEVAFSLAEQGLAGRVAGALWLLGLALATTRALRGLALQLRRGPVGGVGGAPWQGTAAGALAALAACAWAVWRPERPAAPEATRVAVAAACALALVGVRFGKSPLRGLAALVRVAGLRLASFSPQRRLVQPLLRLASDYAQLDRRRFEDAPQAWATAVFARERDPRPQPPVGLAPSPPAAAFALALCALLAWLALRSL